MTSLLSLLLTVLTVWLFGKPADEPEPEPEPEPTVILRIFLRTTGNGHRHVIIADEAKSAALFTHMLRMQGRPDLDWAPLDTVAVCRELNEVRERELAK